MLSLIYSKPLHIEHIIITMSELVRSEDVYKLDLRYDMAPPYCPTVGWMSARIS